MTIGNEKIDPLITQQWKAWRSESGYPVRDRTPTRGQHILKDKRADDKRVLYLAGSRPFAALLSLVVFDGAIILYGPATKRRPST
ncbi:hypothetical protein GWI33_011408 [Rhynchophorus ferrugineus]|uniref:Uncharacterized protein n=1 Tax=Rhynchophorus ferrugineus TaxID=354439 RepID=A0A834IQ46_RHYFE|nr:hypothetical protein GWI33_011408 [Rhynchophorus ferrugineus]